MFIQIKSQTYCGLNSKDDDSKEGVQNKWVIHILLTYLHTYHGRIDKKGKG
jgi:hypothetical protein